VRQVGRFSDATGGRHDTLSERQRDRFLPADRRDVSAAEITAMLLDFAAKGVISKYAAPEHVVFVEELPKTSVGKLNKKELRGHYAKVVA
jgi:acyl-coenzyme A synthetase/AMP-(fatty) acid ligase